MTVPTMTVETSATIRTRPNTCPSCRTGSVFAAWGFCATADGRLMGSGLDPALVMRRGTGLRKVDRLTDLVHPFAVLGGGRQVGSRGRPDRRGAGGGVAAAAEGQRL